VVRRKANRGFVLIEVLVAVAVAAVLLVALLRAFVTTWFGISTVREEAEAMLIARTLISAVTPRENAGELSQQGSIGRYNWALEVRKAAIAPVAGADAAIAPVGGADSETPFAWTLYRAGVVVTAPSGRRTSLETSRLSRP
jgi:prepilin-type N-terminal cleavage/methylation domain-containing protein